MSGVWGTGGDERASYAGLTAAAMAAAAAILSHPRNELLIDSGRSRTSAIPT
jgi:hypothetical protein